MRLAAAREAFRLTSNEGPQNFSRAPMLVARSLALEPRCWRKVQVPEILVVDDSKVMREMVIACLRAREGFSFTQAASGLEAIERLSLQPFDAVVLDLNMPDIGGIEVLEFVRGQDHLRTLPILVVTSRGDDASRDRAMNAGASRFMTKPFVPEVIAAEVASLLDAAGDLS